MRFRLLHSLLVITVVVLGCGKSASTGPSGLSPSGDETGASVSSETRQSSTHGTDGEAVRLWG